MKIDKAARVFALGVLLPFTVVTATSASAEDEKLKGAAEGAAVGAAVGAVTGVGAGAGAAAGAVLGAVGADSKESDKEGKAKPKKEDE